MADQHLIDINNIDKISLEQVPEYLVGMCKSLLLQIHSLREEVANTKNSNPEPESSEKLLTREETAKLLSISSPTLSSWTEEGVLKAYRLGVRIYYKQTEVLSALKEVRTYGSKRVA